MSKSYRMIFISLLSVVLVIAVIGCSSGGEASNKAQSTEQSTSKSGIKQTLQFPTWQGDKLVKDGYIQRYMENKYNVNLEFVPFDTSTYQQKVNLLIASGKTPDYVTGQTLEYEKFVKQGVAAELTPEFVKLHAPLYYAWLEKYLGKDPLRYSTIDGKNYGMPVIWTLGPTNLVTGVRGDWLKKVGIDKAPETLDEFEKAMTKFRENDPDGNGQKDTYGMTGGAESVSGLFPNVFGAFNVYPGAFVEENGKMVRGEIQPGAKQALEVLSKWYKEGLIDPEFVVNKGNNISDKVIGSKVGVVASTWWSFLPLAAFNNGAYHDKLKKNVPSAEWSLSAGPKGPDGHQGMTQTNSFTGGILFFGKQMEKDKEKLAKYLEIFDATSFDKATMEHIFLGEEGTTFKRTSDGGYEFIPPYDQPKERYKFGVDKDVYPMPGSFNDYGLQTPFKTKPELMPVRQKAETIGKGKFDVMAPFIKPVYNENIDGLDRLTLKTYIDIITGKKSVDEFDKYVEDWKKAGGAKTLEEAQSLYDRFNNH